MNVTILYQIFGEKRHVKIHSEMETLDHIGNIHIYKYRDKCEYNT